MEAIVEAATSGKIAGKISAVIANRPDAAGLQFAQVWDIDAVCVDHEKFGTREQFESELVKKIDHYHPDVVVLAGFMRILTPGFIKHYEGRLLNIHPSLLPSFTGLHTHQRALETGVKWHGCTVHFVTPELDCGPIIIQGCVPVLADDDEQTLAERVLAVEHQIYPMAINWFVEKQLVVDNGIVCLKGTNQAPQFFISMPV